ncbi:hypothetical protein [Serratia nematodiphila]|uniref:hypothetical protein n=1 Tax=Serratia nematodiphila TaxID=458197 RepID=UPI0011D65ACE|nr:hypothetical protein [Serratia nematodiphila]TXE66638.1 hypothetical protein FOT58_02420 [Serratia nematodiphila]
MKNKVLLSITMSSLIGLNVGQALANDISPAVTVQTNKQDGNGGKCASGKCGTEKVYGQAKINHDPQDKLVRARDGKCGLTGGGISTDENKVDSNRVVSGVCGQ